MRDLIDKVKDIPIWLYVRYTIMMWELEWIMNKIADEMKDIAKIRK